MTFKQITEVFGFVSVGNNQGSVLTYEVTLQHATQKALLLKCKHTNKTTWIPRSTISETGKLNNFGTKIVYNAGFRAIAAIDII